MVSDAWRALSSIHSLQGLTYGLYAEFQAQEAEFDYLRSMEIEERINDVRTRESNRIPAAATPPSLGFFFERELPCYLGRRGYAWQGRVGP